MPLVEFNWKPTDRQLRQFGVVSAFALPLIGWIWSASNSTLGVLAAIGCAIAVVGWLQPRFIKPIFVALALVATPIGMVLGELMMLLIFLLVFLPMGLLFRVIGRDSMTRQRRSTNTYWQPVRQPKDVASYYRQS